MAQSIQSILEGISLWWVLAIISAIVFIAQAIKPIIELIKKAVRRAEMGDEIRKSLTKIEGVIENINTQVTLNNDGTLAVLRYRIRKQCQRIIDYGYIPEEFVEDLVMMYEAYVNLGGNGATQKIYEEAMKLAIKRKDEVN